MTKPGEYKIDITKKDCEKIVEKIKIQCGLNTKNIKLNPAKHCDLIVQVLEYSEIDQFKFNKIKKENEKKEEEEDNEDNK